MPSQAFTIVDDTLRYSPAYGTLSANAARVLLEVVACLKRAFRQGLLDESALGWVDFPMSLLPFKVNDRTFAKALVDLKQAGFIEAKLIPGRPYQIAMSLKWRSNGYSAHYCTTLVRSTKVPANPPSDSPLKSSNTNHTIQRDDADGGHLHDSKREPEEDSRPPGVNLDALCDALGDVDGWWGRNVVRRAISGHSRGLIARAYRSVKASKHVRCRAALFIYRLQHGWRPPEKRARLIERPSCEEPVQVGDLAQIIALGVAEANRQKSKGQHAYNTDRSPGPHRCNTGTSPAGHQDLTGRSPGLHRQDRGSLP